MYSDLESNESKRREVVSSLYWSLMQGWNIPLSIQEYYGLTEDYRLFHQLEGMNTCGRGRRGKYPTFWRWMQD